MALHTKNGEHAAAEGPPAPAPPAGAPPADNKFRRAEKLRALVKELGPDAADARVLGHARAQGLDPLPSPSAIKRAREALGYPPRRPGPAPRGASARPSPPPPREERAPAPPAAACDVDRFIEGLRLLKEAGLRLGGPAGVRRALEALELLQQ